MLGLSSNALLLNEAVNALIKERGVELPYKESREELELGSQIARRSHRARKVDKMKIPDFSLGESTPEYGAQTDLTGNTAPQALAQPEKPVSDNALPQDDKESGKNSGNLPQNP